MGITASIRNQSVQHIRDEHHRHVSCRDPASPDVASERLHQDGMAWGRRLLPGHCALRDIGAETGVSSETGSLDCLKASALL